MKNFIFILVAMFGLMFYYKWQKQAVPLVSSAPLTLSAKHEKVILYATSWCGYCKATRKLLSENNVKFVEIDVEKSTDTAALKKYDDLNISGVPVLDIQGNIIDGFDENQIVQTLQSLRLIKTS